jgi:hypothetical protein
MAAFLLFVVVGPLVGAPLGGVRGHWVAGCFLGLFLGPVGWLIALLLPKPNLVMERWAGEWTDEYLAAQYLARPGAWRPPLPPGPPPAWRTPPPPRALGSIPDPRAELGET